MVKQTCQYMMLNLLVYNFLIIVTCMVCQNNLKTGVSKLYIELQATSHDRICIHCCNCFEINVFCFNLTFILTIGDFFMMMCDINSF